MNSIDIELLERAIQLSRMGMVEKSGGPFGSVVARAGQVIGEGYNMVLATNDPTAHAEIVAIRRACERLNSFQLTGCDIYASCEPCPMCLGAIYWARPTRIIFANTRADAASIFFDDDFIYRELSVPPSQRKIQCIHHPHPMAMQVFDEWKDMGGKKVY